MLLAYEATRDLPLEPVEIETPLEQTTAYMVSGKKLVLVPILRAGLGMVEPCSASCPPSAWGTSGCTGTTTRSSPWSTTSRSRPTPRRRSEEHTSELQSRE